jgi:pyrroline-5-carboxylate reductase
LDNECFYALLSEPILWVADFSCKADAFRATISVTDRFESAYNIYRSNRWFFSRRRRDILKGISVIGAGNMGAALLRGFVASGKSIPTDVRVFDVDAGKTSPLRKELGVVVVEKLSQAVDSNIDIVIIAVKPQVIGPVLEVIAPQLTDKHVLASIAAGISTRFILSKVGPGARVIRVMPNASAMVGAGASAMCKAGNASEDDLRQMLDLFSSVGTAVPVEEKMMNVVTALSGSGPGYLFIMMEAFTDAAVCMGMDRPTARALTVQTFLGAAAMAQSGASFSELKDRITSPGGTTIAGLKVMEKAGLRGILMDVVEAATKRGAELDQS